MEAKKEEGTDKAAPSAPLFNVAIRGQDFEPVTCTVKHTTPFKLMFDQCAKRRDADVSSFRFMDSSGEPLHQRTVGDFADTQSEEDYEFDKDDSAEEHPHLAIDAMQAQTGGSNLAQNTE